MREATVVEIAIKRVGEPAAPALAAAVNDPRFRTHALPSAPSKTKAWYERSEPLQTVLSCLAETPTADAVPAVAALATDASKDIRKAAAMVLGSTANEEAGEATAQCLSDEATGQGVALAAPGLADHLDYDSATWADHDPTSAC